MENGQPALKARLPRAEGALFEGQVGVGGSGGILPGENLEMWAS